MLDQYIGNSSYFAFPSFTVAIFSILLALVLSTLLALTYRYTFHGDSFPNNFFQALVLSSTVSCMVMMAVGDNLAVGFGVLGAVSIIRFRTLIRNPRNIIFIFASLSIGIATGVFGYAIAISGTVLFCITVILLYLSPYGREGDQKIELAFSTADPGSIDRVVDLLNSKAIKNSPHRIRRSPEGQLRYTLLIGLKAGDSRDDFFQEISALEGLSNVRLELRDSDEQL